MAWLVVGAGVWYYIDQAYTTVYDNTVKPISEWIDEKEKEREEEYQNERKRKREQQREESIKKGNEIRQKFGIPIKDVKNDVRNDAVDVSCW